MKVLSEKEFSNANEYRKELKLDQNIQVDLLIQIARQIESDKVKFMKCYCYSFNSDGTQLNEVYNTIDDISIAKTYPNPYVRFSVDYADRNTSEYKFSIITSTNSNVIDYVVNNAKIEYEKK